MTVNKHLIYLIVVLSVLPLSGTLAARQRSLAELRSLAIQHFVGRGSADGRLLAPSQLDVRETLNRNGLHVFEADTRGFVILADNEQVNPVLAYSTTPFPVADMPDGLQWWMQGMEESLKGLDPVSAPRRAAAFTPVENLLTTEWGQDDPYNFLCPESGGKKMPTGCVATAMSQILNYFRYPAQGHGTGSYRIGHSGSPIAKPIEGVYDYDQMLDTYKGQKLTDDMRIPVATLMRDLGYSCRMTYGTSSSGALTNYAAQGLVTNFDYDSLALHCYYREYFTTEEWMSMIKEEFRHRRPFYYAGSDPKDGGHAFVFSGIDEEGRVYVNWGWTGSGNGYYNIELLAAKDGNRSLGDFSLRQQMIFGFRPAGTPAAGETYQTHIIIQEPISISSLAGSYVNLKLPEVYNLHFLHFYGEIGYLIEPLNVDTDSLFISMLNTAEVGRIIPYYAHDGRSRTQNLKSLPAGRYRVRLVCKPVQIDGFQPVRSYGGINYVEIEKLETGKFVIGEVQIEDAISTPTVDRRSIITPWYDLNGRRVSQPTHGLYIHNGRKVLR